MTKEKLALNLSPYQEIEDDEALSSLTDDITSLALEASGEINPYFLVKTREKRVVNLKRASTDIKDQFAKDSEIEAAETKAALERRDYLLTQNGNFIVIWIGPSNPYPRGSLDVGISREFGGKKALESYGIWIEFTDEQYKTIGRNLASISSNDVEIDEASDLRDKTFLLKLSEKDNPYDLLEEIIPLEGIWERIRNGAAKRQKEKARKYAEDMAKESLKKIKGAGTRQEILEIGAILERQMQRRWDRINFEKSGCGRTNHEALNQYGYTYSHYHIDSKGSITRMHSESGQFVKKCPHCKTEINAVIKPGYKCSCGKEYKGVC